MRCRVGINVLFTKLELTNAVRHAGVSVPELSTGGGRANEEEPEPGFVDD
jgi:hypothetical protein